ncbi:hypothetical protein QFC22_000734 [Naganishia vaughanmartiniae]|uniref:Uncharacterized protein n=1 Tax=Naganishia vaughanmartiniae TaxID=1424756 RepID=A0ACC2XJC1_9TREE|nr:hypothetical protein QFC22_000734 [Naganishia vaughanmartiniae]
MSALPENHDMRHESLEEEEKRLGPDHETLPAWLDVKKQLTFYASYHSHPINIAIHMVCIPLILWSFILYLAHIPLFGGHITRIAPWLSFQPNAALLYNAAYVAYYFALEPVAAMTYLPHAIISQLTTTYLATTPASAHPFGLSSLRIATYGQLFGWISQFLGHGFAEGRAPALLDSLLQDNPKLQAEIARGVRQDKLARAAKKGKKVL